MNYIKRAFISAIVLASMAFVPYYVGKLLWMTPMFDDAILIEVWGRGAAILFVVALFGFVAGMFICAIYGFIKDGLSYE